MVKVRKNIAFVAAPAAETSESRAARDASGKDVAELYGDLTGTSARSVAESQNASAVTGVAAMLDGPQLCSG